MIWAAWVFTSFLSMTVDTWGLRKSLASKASVFINSRNYLAVPWLGIPGLTSLQPWLPLLSFPEELLKSFNSPAVSSITWPRLATAQCVTASCWAADGAQCSAQCHPGDNVRASHSPLWSWSSFSDIIIIIIHLSPRRANTCIQKCRYRISVFPDSCPCPLWPPSHPGTGHIPGWLLLLSLYAADNSPQFTNRLSIQISAGSKPALSPSPRLMLTMALVAFNTNQLGVASFRLVSI